MSRLGIHGSLLLVATAFALACTSASPPACPGTPIGTFTFTLTASASTVSSPTDCQPTPPPSLGTQVGTPFVGTLTTGPVDGSATLCLGGSHAVNYVGSVTAGTYTLTADSGLAVLATCGSNCVTTSTEEIDDGSIAQDGTFSGFLTESFVFSAGDCGTCVSELPCSVQYGLAGSP